MHINLLTLNTDTASILPPSLTHEIEGKIHGEAQLPTWATNPDNQCLTVLHCVTLCYREKMGEWVSGWVGEWMSGWGRVRENESKREWDWDSDREVLERAFWLDCTSFPKLWLQLHLNPKKRFGVVTVLKSFVVISQKWYHSQATR